MSIQPTAEAMALLKASILEQARQHGHVQKLLLVPDPLNREFVCRIVTASAEYRTKLAQRFKGLIIGETVYFVIPMAERLIEAG